MVMVFGNSSQLPNTKRSTSRFWRGAMEFSAGIAGLPGRDLYPIPDQFDSGYAFSVKVERSYRMSGP